MDDFNFFFCFLYTNIIILRQKDVITSRLHNAREIHQFYSDKGDKKGTSFTGGVS